MGIWYYDVLTFTWIDSVFSLQNLKLTEVLYVDSDWLESAQKLTVKWTEVSYTEVSLGEVGQKINNFWIEKLKIFLKNLELKWWKR